jgi:DeoR family transcriptional regulator, fructose operon transcriptional repressor
MQLEERQKRIEEYLFKVEYASLEDIASKVDASVSTVRRDLTELETLGNIRRTHGGARVVTPKTDEFAFSRRDTLQLAEKEAIGQICASLIQPGQSVIVDAGTTAFHVARHLEGETLQVITNSLPVANLFASSQQIEVVVSGGVIYPRLGVLVGPLAVEGLSKLNADVAIMSGGGITLDGVTNSHALLIEIQHAMIRAAGKVIFCLDSTKFDRKSVAQVCDLSVIDNVITDSGAPARLVAGLRERGVEVLIAPVVSTVVTPAPPPQAPTIQTTKRIRRARRPLIKQPSTSEPPKPAPNQGGASESADNRMGWD